VLILDLAMPGSLQPGKYLGMRKLSKINCANSMLRGARLVILEPATNSRANDRLGDEVVSPQWWSISRGRYLPFAVFLADAARHTT